MDEDRLHVVFGTGQVGKALTTQLVRQGLAVRAVPRRQPPAPDEGVNWRPADVLLAAADAGRVRAAVGRASDFGPGVTEGSTLG